MYSGTYVNSEDSTSTQYYGFFQNDTGDNAFNQMTLLPVPVACTVSSLSVNEYVSFSSTSSDTLTFTLYKTGNTSTGVTTSITVQPTNPNNGTPVTSTVSASYSLAAGDVIVMGVSQTNPSLGVNGAFSINCK